MPVTWTFDKKTLNDICGLNMPKNWNLDVFRVKRSSSDHWWWVQVLREKEPSGQDDKGCAYRQAIVLCDCPSGKFAAPLIVLGLSDFICVHGKALLEYLNTR